MKKILIATLIVAGLLTSCKKAANAVQDAGNAVVETTKDAASGAADLAGDAANATKDAAGNVVDATGNAIGDAANAVKDAVLGDISVPEFSVPGLSANVTEYANYAKEYLAAHGDVAKISQLAPKGSALLAKGAALAAKLKPEELTNYKKLISTIQSKMAPAADAHAGHSH